MNRRYFGSKFLLILLSFWLLLSCGCVRRPPVATPYPRPGPQQDGGHKKEATKSIRQPAPENPLAAAIRKQARQLVNQGKLKAAAQTIERGLRIAPKDGWLWLNLAEIRLNQGRPDQAAALARKAGSLARNDPALRERARQIIKAIH